MRLEHQSQGKAGAWSDRLRADGGAAQIGVDFVRFAADQTQTETVDQTADHGEIGASLMGADEGVDSRAGHIDGVGRQSLNGQRRAAHGNDRHVQVFSFKDPHLCRNP